MTAGRQDSSIKVDQPCSYDALVIGGGFFGCRLALYLRRSGRRVLLVERGPALLGRASLRNQARVHGGYHYPRSILTSLRSRMNYARFVAEYADCIDDGFAHYYAIARGTSNVTASQFAEFCRRIDAPLSPAPDNVVALFDRSRIEAVFLVQECAFDAVRLAARLERELRDADVDVWLNAEALRVDHAADGVTAVVARDGEEQRIGAQIVLNCTYSRLNSLLAASGASTVPAKHELTEMALVEPPAELHGAAVTVMDGPFFSLMPYPSRGLSTLSHVRYTPHASWMDEGGASAVNADDLLAARHSAFPHMIRDAGRYLPAIRSARYVDSIWEVKTVMPRSEQDDSRPILLHRSREIPALFTVLGAKIDSVYDVEDAFSCLSPS